MTTTTETTIIFGSTVQDTSVTIKTIIFGGQTTAYIPVVTSINTTIFGSFTYVPPPSISTTGTIIYGSNGDAITEICVEYISETKKQRVVVFDIPTANKDIVQTLGTKNRLFNIKGFVTGSTGNSSLRALPGTTGSITHATATGVVFLPRTQVFYSNVEFEDRAGKPFIRGFSISAVELS